MFTPVNAEPRCIETEDVNMPFEIGAPQDPFGDDVSIFIRCEAACFNLHPLRSSVSIFIRCEAACTLLSVRRTKRMWRLDGQCHHTSGKKQPLKLLLLSTTSKTELSQILRTSAPVRIGSSRDLAGSLDQHNLPGKLRLRQGSLLHYSRQETHLGKGQRVSGKANGYNSHTRQKRTTVGHAKAGETLVRGMTRLRCLVDGRKRILEKSRRRFWIFLMSPDVMMPGLGRT